MTIEIPQASISQIPMDDKIGKQNQSTKEIISKKTIGTGGTIALSASLAALASFGTYLVMKAKSNKALELLKIELNNLTSVKNKLEVRTSDYKNEIEVLKRTIRSKEDMIDILNDDITKVRNDLRRKKKEIFNLEKELNK